ncbi:uncharacterized protein B0I36DRAFT_17329 [Microdochium trichocladiopsis]|uniref:BHLH domain-containing protein n=1 Tax=Microdochium trichocladiopsis TaxID=1682393 RepID=A0A9P8YL18_9PEZI|nr:uncharacterized protein B0I36DRAFT_17329 [Microdochium trichocladiopsis]KAH7040959.1 hypothetical protein B0I36DRAFT_17329 [Microdochium trichocladiopsis]
MDPSVMQGIDAFQPSAHDAAASSPDQPAAAVKPQHLSKKRKCAEPKPPSAQDLSALDCSDYWLRFDSDTESITYPQDNETSSSSQAAAQSRSFFNAFTPNLRGGLAYPGDFGLSRRSPSNDLLDDSPLDNALSEEEDIFSALALDEELRRTEAAPIPNDVPPRETLYSTPLSWEPPQPGVRMESYINMNPAFNNPEQRRLLAIAMGTGQAFSPDGTRPDAIMDFNFDDITHSPASTNARPRRPQPPTRTDSSEKQKMKPKSSERAAHNDIERKYRTNLKDRISELRDAVPSLRAIPEDPDDDSGAAASRSTPKVSKGTILTKATEYIHQLERRNRSMEKKHEELCRRLQAFEQLVGATPSGPTWQPQGYGTAVFNPRAFP